MAADYNKPVTTDNYADLLTQLRENIAAAQTMLNDLTSVTNIPTDAVRYDQTLNKFQSYNGSTFDDLVLSPSGGGTGITNWAKASTAEAEAGTADKYPDAAGVLAAINANATNFSGLSVVFSGSTSLLDVSSYDNGLYLVKTSSVGGQVCTQMVYIRASGASQSSARGGLGAEYHISVSAGNMSVTVSNESNYNGASGTITEVSKLV